MGFWKNCKFCSKPAYLSQEIDGSWTPYEDDNLAVNHICQKSSDVLEKKLGNIFEIGSCSRKIGYNYAEPYEYDYKAWEAFYVGRVGESHIKDILRDKFRGHHT